jgi:hypothetical protein
LMNPTPKFTYTIRVCLESNTIIWRIEKLVLNLLIIFKVYGKFQKNLQVQS